MFKRAFVMFPLREIDPELPIFNSQNIGEILEKLRNQSIFKITEQSWWRI
jgi:7,8-dihydro-6-hydroxymethylpterin-pyrophosphokinase